MTIEVSSVPRFDVSASLPGRELETFDERWAAWRAKGIARDRALRRKIGLAGSVVIIAAAFLISVALAP